MNSRRISMIRNYNRTHNVKGSPLASVHTVRESIIKGKYITYNQSVISSVPTLGVKVDTNKKKKKEGSKTFSVE